MVNLNDVTNVHFIGIAGAGMRAIANVFIEKGYHVSGSDLKASPVTEQFAKKGARICIGQRPENLQDAQVVVISSAIRDTNVELAEVRRRGIPVIHRSDALVHIMSWGKGISVAGAHGKTTTSSMLGQVFEECHQDPTIVIGGEVDYLHSNSILGKGAYVIAEADESDGTFLKQNPYIAVVTNIDADHMDHYGSLENVIAAFKQFIQKLDPEEGLAVLCFENDKIRALAPQTGRRYVSYGIEQPADYQASDLHYLKGKLHFSVYKHGEKMGDMVLNVPGRHNVLNALATTAVADACGLPFDGIASAMSHFHGAKRRFQTKGFVGDVWVVDDYAHHPRELAAALTSVRRMFPGRRVTAVFQPHLYTRTRDFYREFAEALSQADEVLLLPIYPAREEPIEGIASEIIAERVTVPCRIVGREALAATLGAAATDVVVSFGAGNIDACCDAVADVLRKKA